MMLIARLLEEAAETYNIATSSAPMVLAPSAVLVSVLYPRPSSKVEDQVIVMKSAFLTALAVIVARKVAGHAIFQDLWVDGVDMISASSPCSIRRRLVVLTSQTRNSV